MRARAQAIAAAIGQGVRPAAAGGLGALFDGLKERVVGWLALEQERGRAFLFLPVGYGAGILLYFSAADEPSLWGPFVATALLALLAYRFRDRRLAFLVATALASVAAGFAAATARTAIAAHPVLGAETGSVTISGWVEVFERRENGDRLTLRIVRAEPALAQPLQRVRVTSRVATGVQTGAAVSLMVRLRPPADPPGPGLYDFGRDAFFNGIGASGFVIGQVRRIELGEAPLGVRLRTHLDRVRSAISERIRAAIPGHAGAVADALVTGKRDGIPEGLNEAMRAAGTYHILSISGFHMALVAALVFVAVRGSLALIPSLALNRPVKAWAAFAALVVSTCYLVISGAEVATQRSWIMIAVVLIGVMLGRGALTLRTLALAALLVLTLAPESLLGPSFQMSFAATLALVSGYAMLRPWAEHHAGDRRGFGRALLAISNGVAGLAMSSFVASLATTPYAAYHFNQIQLYGVPGNLLGAPIVEFLTMPLEIIALLLWPLGLDRPVWALAGMSIDLFIRVAEWVASWPGGKVAVPTFGPLALGLLSIGLICLAMLSTPLRLIGVPVAVLGLTVAPLRERPLMAIDAEGLTVAARGTDGRLRALSPRANRFALQRWLAADADQRLASDQSLIAGVICDAIGCAMALQGGGRVAYARDPEALADDCREARLVVTRFPPPADCKATVLNLRGLAWTGAITLFAAEGGYRIEVGRDPASQRPWFRPRPAGAPVPLLRRPGPAADPATPQPAAEGPAPDEFEPDR
ncbi:ComEC/Rec2 family competence protein [Phreatobacter stygius]|uniref:ComEC family competence protein n=1 Tax=Phreatobacter stygius TaxID=1940610 RepID=A0A4D7BC98_9HYPH|nr:ComEC/Rec2 family competence protein [Phreatobacter stygius]QCI68420.1 ComEC family competence protein [Phreatobacter stygius]